MSRLWLLSQLNYSVPLACPQGLRLPCPHLMEATVRGLGKMLALWYVLSATGSPPGSLVLSWPTFIFALYSQLL